jgi:hypothetical protein
VFQKNPRKGENMSNRNGDKSRHHRQRKQNIQRRAASAALKEGAAAKGGQPAKKTVK